MKEKISIKKFSILKNIDLELNKINILIGEQATGKTLIAKLVYFFKTLPDIFLDATIKGMSKEGIKQTIEDDFEDIFPKYLWKNQNFEIKYYYQSNYHILLKNTNGLEITFNDNLLSEINQLQKYVEKFENRERKSTIFQNDIENKIMQLFFNKELDTTYIPAERASIHLKTRNIIYDTYFNIIKISKTISKEKYIYDYPELNELSTLILKGEYRIFNNKEHIISNTDNKKVDLKDTASGQKSVLPIILIMQSLYDEQKNNEKVNDFVLIDEPETHLSPATQNLLVKFFALCYNTNQTNLFITTHSPFIVSYFDNLIYANNVLEIITQKKKKEKINNSTYQKLMKKLNIIIPPEQRIKFEDISLYHINNGKNKIGIWAEEKLIRADFIDEVSEKSGKEFNNLLEIENYEE